VSAKCPLLGVKRTSAGRAIMSAFDPKRTFHFALRMSAIGGKAEHSAAFYVCVPWYNTLAILDAIRRDIALTRLVTSVSARPKFVQSLAFKAWQLLVTLVFSPFSFTHVHSSWHCCCWASAIEGIAVSPTASTTFFSMVASLIKDATHEASSL